MRITATARRGLTAALAAALGTASLVVAPAASAAPPGYQVRTVQVSVPAGGYVRQRAACPSGWVPVNGGVSTTSAAADDYTRLQASGPRLYQGGADTGWEVALHNDAGSTRTYTVYAVCLADVPGYRLTVANLPVAAHSWATAQAICPASKIRLGGGVTLNSDSYFTDRNIAIVDTSAISPHGWASSIRNDDGTPLSAVVWAVCSDPSEALAVSGTHAQVKVGQVIFGTPARSATVTCPNGGTAVGGGAWPVRGRVNTRIMTSAPAAGSGSWTVTLRNYEWFNQVDYFLFAYCLP